jgi:Fe-S cluster assembly ATP-binding protein
MALLRLPFALIYEVRFKIGYILAMMKKKALHVENLDVSVEGVLILKQCALSISPGSIHVLMGANGSGKSTLAHTLMGHPRYKIKAGHMYLFDHEINRLTPDARAKLGLFLSFQQPQELPGMRLFTLLKEAKRALTGKDVSVDEFYGELLRYLDCLQIDQSFAYRNVNEGFSGGEKKRLELLQLLMLKPQIAILDEIDSGLDVDALKSVADGLQFARNENPEISMLIITHYQRILKYIEPDYVHIMHDGRIVQSGDKTLVDHIEQQGYDGYKKIET